MNYRTTASSLIAAACVAAASAAHASPFTDHASFELFAGGNVATPGSFHGEALPSNAPGADGPIGFNHLDYSDAYQHRYTGGAEFDYSFDSNFAAFARAGYSQFDGRQHDIGTLFGDAGAQPIGARFEDTKSRELDLGARYTFVSGARIRPFVGVALGATHLSATRADVDNIDGVGTTRVELGRAGTVFQQRVETGLQFSPMPNFDLRLTAAATHLDGGPRSDDPNLALIGLESARGDSGHWSYPAELGVVWHF
jgi:hypothetical protein